MIQTKEQLKEYIHVETSFLSNKVLMYLPFDIFEAQIIAKYLMLLRKTEYHTNVGHKIRGLYYLLRLKKKQCRYGVHIPINVFEKGLSIAHLGTIIVNGNAKVGENCRIHVGVVIGANGENKPGGCQYWETISILDQEQKYLEKYKLWMDVKLAQML